GTRGDEEDGDTAGVRVPGAAGESGPYRLTAGRTAYASVLTIADRADPQARRVRSVTVSADPSLAGRSFTARELGAGATVRVWEPVTTWWKPSAAAADRALGLR
ncbi:Tat pathway signal sequence domain protein, partial [Streptomyces sp. NPDC005534]